MEGRLSRGTVDWEEGSSLLWAEVVEKEGRWKTEHTAEREARLSEEDALREDGGERMSTDWRMEIVVMVVGERRVGRKAEGGWRVMKVSSVSVRKTGVRSPVVMTREEGAAEVDAGLRLRIGEGGGGRGRARATHPTSAETVRVRDDEATRLPSPPATTDLDLRSP